MNEDPRCCGSGTCIIGIEGRCWCGQQWDGQKMCLASLAQAEGPGRADVALVWLNGYLSERGRDGELLSGAQTSLALAGSLPEVEAGVRIAAGTLAGDVKA